jgi:plastocyanin
MAFHPAELAVAPGDTVVWINRDIVPHTATAGGRREWTTGLLASGDSGSQVIRQPGPISYRCALHPTMRGTLTVEALAR